MRIKKLAVSILAVICVLTSALSVFAATYSEFSVKDAHNGYVSGEEGSITVVANEDYLVGTDENGPFSDSVISEITDNNPGTIYYADDEGNLLGHADDYVKIDSTAPTVTSVKTTSSMDNVYFRDSGIYSDDNAELTLKVTAEDNESGIDSVTLYGEDEDGNIEKYQSTSETTDDNVITSTFTITKSASLYRSALYIKVKDNVGNESELTLIDNTKSESTLTIEDTLPSISGPVITGAKTNGWYSDVPHIESTISDTGSGLLNVKIISNGTDTIYEEDFTDEDQSFDLDTYFGGETKSEARDYIESRESEVNGRFTLTIIATDNCGNISSKNVDLNISLDKPSVTVSGVQDGEYYRLPPEITVKSSDKHAEEKEHVIHISVKKNGAINYAADVKGVSEYKIPAERFSDDAEYTLTTSVTGVSGLESDQKTITFIKDNTAPEIKINSLESLKNSNGWIKTPVAFTFTIDDETSDVKDVKTYINDKEEAYTANGNNYTVSLTADEIHALTNADDIYTLKVTSEDKSGNTSSAELTVNIDIDRPVLTLSGVTNGSYLQKEKDISLSSSDKNAGKSGNSYHIAVTRGIHTIKTEDVKAGSTYIIDKSLFSLDGSYTIIASTTDPAGNVSEEKTISFTKDETKPELLIDNIDSGKNRFGWLNKPVSFTFKATDAISGIKDTKAYINGSEVACPANEGIYHVDLTSSLISSLINDAGTYTLRVSTTDRAGNTTSGEETIKVDIVDPKLSIAGIDDGDYIQEEHDLVLKSDDKNSDKEGNRYTYSITRNGKNIKSDTVFDKGAFTIDKKTFSVDGKYTIKATTTDPADNTSKEETLEFTKDSTPPVVTYKNVTGGNINKNGWFNRPIKYHFDAYDETAGIHIVQASINGTSVPFTKDGTSYTVSLTKDLIASLINSNGTYVFNIDVTDRSGNSRSITNTYKVDIVHPMLTISGIEKGKHYKTTPTLSIKTNERFYSKNGAFIKVIIKRDNVVVSDKKYTGTNSFTCSSFTTDGDYTVTVLEEDAAGNAAVPRSISFTKDSTAPVISISGVTEGAFYNRTIIPKVMVRERYYRTETVNIAVTRTLKGKKFDHAFPFSPTGEITTHSAAFSESGEYVISVTAKDEAGNIATPKKISFKVDTKPPKVEIRDIEDAGIYGYESLIAPKILFSDDYLDSHKLSVTRAGESWLHNLKTAEQSGYIQFYDFPKSKKNDGAYELSITVKDKAGNVTKKSVSFSVNRYGSSFQYMDDVKEYNNGYFKNINDNLHIMEFNVNDLKNTQNIIKRDGETVSSTNTYKTRPDVSGFKRFEHTFDSGDMQEEGVYTLDVISSDKAGNTTESAKDAGDIRIVVDRTKPSISISGTEKRQYKAKKLEISIDSTDLLSPVHTEVKLNNVAIEPEHDNIYSIPEGINQNITVTSTDEAGNSNTVNEHVTVTSNSLLYTALKYWLPIICGLFALLIAIVVPFAYALSKTGKGQGKHSAKRKE